MLKLAKLYLLIEDLDSCQHQCMTLLKNDNENDAATVVCTQTSEADEMERNETGGKG